jgi:hypothetical protein
VSKKYDTAATPFHRAINHPTMTEGRIVGLATAHTAKARKAFELQDKGQDIEVMTEDDFLRCLDGKPLDGAACLPGSWPSG